MGPCAAFALLFCVSCIMGGAKKQSRLAACWDGRCTPARSCTSRGKRRSWNGPPPPPLSSRCRAYCTNDLVTGTTVSLIPVTGGGGSTCAIPPMSPNLPHVSYLVDGV